MRMPVFIDTSVANPRITIPADLPDLMKQYTKAAIRTQPRDMLRWSTAYFMALAKGDYLPVKERIEFIPKESAWISLGFLRIIHRQIRIFIIQASYFDHTCTMYTCNNIVSTNELRSNWENLCLSKDRFQEIITRGQFGDTVEWLSFLAIACSRASKDLKEALKLFCEVITEDPEGCPARVSIDVISQAYVIMAKEFGISDQSEIHAFQQYLADCAKVQNDKVHPGNIFCFAHPKVN